MTMADRCNHRDGMSHCAECCEEEHAELYKSLSERQSALTAALERERGSVKDRDYWHEIALQLGPAVHKAENELRELARDERIFIPGSWKCEKCGFVLTRTSINANTGEFGTTAQDREDTEPCPNDGTEMVRVSWQERAMELSDTLGSFYDDPMKFWPYEQLRSEWRIQNDAIAEQHDKIAAANAEIGRLREAAQYVLDLIDDLPIPSNVEGMEPGLVRDCFRHIIADQEEAVAQLKAALAKPEKEDSNG